MITSCQVLYVWTLQTCWKHYFFKNYPLMTFWTVTMGIDSACQTKALLIVSHYVHCKTNFFQVPLPNWNTLLWCLSVYWNTPNYPMQYIWMERAHTKWKAAVGVDKALGNLNGLTFILSLALFCRERKKPKNKQQTTICLDHANFFNTLEDFKISGSFLKWRTLKFQEVFWNGLLV